MEQKKKRDRIKILYIIFFVILFLELVGSFVGFFSGSAEIRNASASNTFLIVLTSIALIVPWFIEVKYKVDIPDILEFIVLLMLFIAVVLGFLHDYYENVTGFDKITHTLSGVTLAILSFQTIVFLNRWEKANITMGTGMSAMFSFMFTITLLVIWEFYEFMVDTVSFRLNPDTTSNMQRYQWVSSFTRFPQDYGLYDTMMDLILGAIGALVVAVIGYVLIRRSPKYSNYRFLKTDES